VNELNLAAAAMHDSEVVGIEINRKNKIAKLALLTESAETWCFECDGVALIRAVDFIDQNVVSRLLISSVFIFSESQIRHWLNWLSSLIDMKSNMTPEILEAYKKKIEIGDMSLLVLEPSRGMELGVLSRTVRYSRVK